MNHLLNTDSLRISYQRSSRTRVCRTCLCSAPEVNFTSTEFPLSWRPTGSEASPCTTCPSLTGALLSWSSAARSWRSFSPTCRTTGRLLSSECQVKPGHGFTQFKGLNILIAPGALDLLPSLKRTSARHQFSTRCALFAFK